MGRRFGKSIKRGGIARVRFKEILSKLDSFFHISISTSLMLFMTFATTYYALTRRVLGMSDVRAYFISLWAYGIFFVLGGAYCLRRRTFPEVDIFYRRISSQKLRRLWDIAIFLMMIFGGIGISYTTTYMAILSYILNEKDVNIGIAFQPPIWWYKFVGALGCYLITLQAIILFLKYLRTLK